VPVTAYLERLEVCPDERVLRWRDEGASAENDEDVVELRDLTDEQEEFERYTCPTTGDLQESDDFHCIATVGEEVGLALGGGFSPDFVCICAVVYVLFKADVFLSNVGWQSLPSSGKVFQAQD